MRGRGGKKRVGEDMGGINDLDLDVQCLFHLQIILWRGIRRLHCTFFHDSLAFRIILGQLSVE